MQCPGSASWLSPATGNQTHHVLSIKPDNWPKQRHLLNSSPEATVHSLMANDTVLSWYSPGNGRRPDRGEQNTYSPQRPGLCLPPGLGLKQADSTKGQPGLSGPRTKTEALGGVLLFPMVRRITRHLWDLTNPCHSSQGYNLIPTHPEHWNMKATLLFPSRLHMQTCTKTPPLTRGASTWHTGIWKHSALSIHEMGEPRALQLSFALAG